MNLTKLSGEWVVVTYLRPASGVIDLGYRIIKFMNNFSLQAELVYNNPLSVTKLVGKTPNNVTTISPKRLDGLS